MRVALKLLVARMSAPAATKRRAIPATIVGPGQVEQVVIAALVVVERELAAIVGLVQPLGLDLGAVGAVLDQDALRGGGADVVWRSVMRELRANGRWRRQARRD